MNDHLSVMDTREKSGVWSRCRCRMGLHYWITRPGKTFEECQYCGKWEDRWYLHVKAQSARNRTPDKP